MKNTHERWWAVTLILDELERLEDRILAIVEHTAIETDERCWEIEELDATGRLGNQLTRQANETSPIGLIADVFLELLREDGQIVELDATLKKNGCDLLRVLVRDGLSVDVLGTGEPLGTDVLGSHKKIDPTLFL
ncbi:hypothetical protein BE21_24400 [Sorangium cellulosum]|uniref:Uncharacterized protein n=1 Tax=Sorangium cellulosum TaxID=56 RepID=A0A150TUC2_SORCE|nr:hypothetical protein BE21_24400 [Sorangium cellulosum]